MNNNEGLPVPKKALEVIHVRVRSRKRCGTHDMEAMRYLQKVEFIHLAHHGLDMHIDADPPATGKVFLEYWSSRGCSSTFHLVHINEGNIRIIDSGDVIYISTANEKGVTEVNGTGRDMSDWICSCIEPSGESQKWLRSQNQSIPAVPEQDDDASSA